MDFRDVFENGRTVIGMIHLAGDDTQDKVNRALEELAIFDGYGLDGAIFEDYHGDKEDVVVALEASQNIGLDIVRGVNVLSDPYSSFELARRYGAKFVQHDSVQRNDIFDERHDRVRGEYSDILLLGGIRFKYTTPTGDSLEEDVRWGKAHCEVIVTTGDGTGQETPMEK